MSAPSPAAARDAAMLAHRARRRRADRRFLWYGRAAVTFAFLVLAFLLGAVCFQGYGGFLRSEIRLEVDIAASAIDPEGMRNPGMLSQANYQSVIYSALKTLFPDADTRPAQRRLYALISEDAGEVLRARVMADPSLIGTRLDLWLPASDLTDLYRKGKIDTQLPETERKLKDNQWRWLRSLESSGALRLAWNRTLFSQADSRAPERAGFLGAMAGSLLTLLICMSAAFPLGVITAVYLEEFAPRNRLFDIIEININNLAAVPSIVFGLLGLSLFIHFMGMPRSAPVVGGLTLSLMILPVIIITTRVALKSIPASIRSAAMALGASPFQVVLHHVLPLALPGIMTGTILSVARAMGETAPLLMIGMVAFIADIPASFTDPATVMPVQIYLWTSSAEAAFVEKTAAGIMLLLGVLVVLNSLAIYVRKRFECRW